MCSDAILLYGIPQVVVGENKTYQGPEDYVRERGVDVEILDDDRCVQMKESFIEEEPSLWNEDIGEP